jgi:hypothetical protein
MTEKFHCVAGHAPLFLGWLKAGRGIAVWRSENLSNPGASWSSPARMTNGEPQPKPTWEASSIPERVIEDIDDVVVDIPRLVQKFHVGVRAKGTRLEVTTGGSRKIRTAVEKAGKDAWYEFDYETQEAMIFVPDQTVTLAEWAKK